MGIDNIDSLELFSTYFYLRNQSKCCEEEAKKKLLSIKNHLLTSNPDQKLSQIETNYSNIKTQLASYQLQIA